MSNNCLVTKLKAVVDNPELEVLGQLDFKVSASTHLDGVNIGTMFGFNYEPATEVKIIGDSDIFFVLDGNNVGQSITRFWGQSISNENHKAFVLRFNRKYNINKIQIASKDIPFDIKELLWLNEASHTIALQLAGNKEVTGDLSVFSKMDDIVLSGTGNKGDLRNYLSGTSVYGDLSTLPSWVYNVGSTLNYYTWTLGNRAGGDNLVMVIYSDFAGATDFETNEDLDNYFIDNAKCTLSSEGRKEIVIHTAAGITDPMSYIPSSETKGAIVGIAHLLSMGITSIIINGNSVTDFTYNAGGTCSITYNGISYTEMDE